MMLKFYQPFLFRYGSTNNSPSPNRFMPSLKLSDEAQQALISRHTFSIIMTSEPNNYFMHQCSLRQKILDRKYFKQSFLSTIKSENKLGMKNEQLNMNWLDEQFAEKNYDQVFKGFQISAGAPYNQVIFPQDRMFQTSINGCIALFPVPSNRIYYLRISNPKSRIISGTKGTGKSFALFSIIYFNQFMVRFMTHNYSFENRVFLPLVKEKQWNIVPYICYINIKDKTSYNFYFRQIMLQFQYLYPIKQIIQDFNISQKPKDYQQMTKQQLITLLREIKSKALKNTKIQTVCFMDEANQIFRIFRQLKQWVIQKKHLPNFIQQELWKNTTFYKDLVFYYELLYIFTDETKKTSFNSIIFNSSQYFQLQLFQDESIPPEVIKSLDLIRLLKEQRLFGRSKTSNAGTNNIAGVFQLYQILWFEIIKNLEQRYLLKSQSIDLTYQSKLKEHKKCFNKTFGLDNFPNFSANKGLNMVDWQCQITHLNIRQYFTNHQGYQLSFLSNTNNIFSYQNPTQQQLTLFSKELKLLKEKFQKYKIDCISVDMIKYVSKGVNYLEKFKRNDNLRQILLEAEKIRKINKQGQQGSSQTYKNQEYLKSEQLTAAKIQLVETIKIGYVHEGKLKFNMKPKYLIHAISQTLVSDDFYKILAQNIVMLVLDSATKTINKDVGKILDRLSYPIFKDGNLKLLYAQRKLQQGKKIIIQQKIQEIRETCFIDSISGNQYKEGIFNKVIEAANNNKSNQYTAGYPVIQAQNNKVPSQNNMTFDCMIARKVQETDQKQDKYKFLFYDWTFGRPGSKEKKDFIDKIKKYLQMANLKADIECKLLIVAPQIFVESYVNWYEETYLSSKKSGSNSTYQYKLFLKEVHKYKIEGVQYKWDISVGLASFNEYRPFYSPNTETQTKKIIISTIQKCYSQIQKKFYQQGKKSSQKKN